MNQFLKLLNFEINRFSKLYIGLLMVIFFTQTLGTIFIATSFMKEVKRMDPLSDMGQAEFMDAYWRFEMNQMTYSLPFLAPILVGITALMFYLFFIWYRDWFAKNTFIYRLFTLPTARMNVYFAKLATIMLSVLGLVAFQLVLLVVHRQVVSWIIPKPYRIDHTIAETVTVNEVLRVIMPVESFSFIVYYLLGLAFVVVIFTAILLERSFRLKGIIAGFIYVGLAITIFLLPQPAVYLITGKNYLYPEEIIAVQAVLWIIIMVISLLLSRFLINKKVTV